MGNLPNTTAKVAITCATFRKNKTEKRSAHEKYSNIKMISEETDMKADKKVQGKVGERFSALIRGECKAEGMFVPFPISKLVESLL